jgi:predicted DNA-binding mobile mystery protein A
MGVRQPTIADLERSEAKGSIKLVTLQRAAEALDCTLVYALIPNKALETTIRDRARAFVRRRRQPVEHTMLLEDQQVAEPASERQIDDIVRETNPRLFWD